MITIIAIGKKHESWIQEGLERYQKRLKQPWNIEWVLLPHSSFEGARARQEETERILSRLDARDYVVVLDERGKMLDSPALSTLVDEQFVSSKPIVFVIGGAYGVDERLYGGSQTSRANMIWSLSSLVFPHQLVRLLLVEQLYRAQEIASGGAYHHH